MGGGRDGRLSSAGVSAPVCCISAREPSIANSRNVSSTRSQTGIQVFAHAPTLRWPRECVVHASSACTDDHRKAGATSWPRHHMCSETPTLPFPLLARLHLQNRDTNITATRLDPDVSPSIERARAYGILTRASAVIATGAGGDSGRKQHDGAAHAPAPEGAAVPCARV